jgi:hypothetical protein
MHDSTKTTQRRDPNRGRSVKLLPLAGLLLAATLSVSACSWQTLSMSAAVNGPAKASTATGQASATGSKVAASAAKATGSASTVVAAPLPPLVRGALAAGSVAHVLAAGSRNLVIDYWTTQNVAAWTSNLTVPINVSAHMEDSDTAHAVEVTQFKATLATDASANVTTLMGDIGQFVITPPYSYGSVLIMPAEPAAAHTATISIQFDLLIETAPKSGTYFRQTVLDTLPITFVAQPTATVTPSANSTPSATQTQGAQS